MASTFGDEMPSKPPAPGDTAAKTIKGTETALDAMAVTLQRSQGLSARDSYVEAARRLYATTDTAEAIRKKVDQALEERGLPAVDEPTVRERNLEQAQETFESALEETGGNLGEAVRRGLVTEAEAEQALRKVTEEGGSYQVKVDGESKALTPEIINQATLAEGDRFLGEQKEARVRQTLKDIAAAQYEDGSYNLERALEYVPNAEYLLEAGFSQEAINRALLRRESQGEIAGGQVALAEAVSAYKPPVAPETTESPGDAMPQESFWGGYGVFLLGAEEPSGYAPGLELASLSDPKAATELSQTSAEWMIPGLYTATYWTVLDTKGRALSLGTDIAAAGFPFVVKPVGAAIRGTGRGVTATATTTVRGLRKTPDAVRAANKAIDDLFQTRELRTIRSAAQPLKTLNEAIASGDDAAIRAAGARLERLGEVTGEVVLQERGKSYRVQGITAWMDLPKGPTAEELRALTPKKPSLADSIAASIRMAEEKAQTRASWLANEAARQAEIKQLAEIANDLTPVLDRDLVDRLESVGRNLKASAEAVSQGQEAVAREAALLTPAQIQARARRADGWMRDAIRAMGGDPDAKKPLLTLSRLLHNIRATRETLAYSQVAFAAEEASVSVTRSKLARLDALIAPILQDGGKVVESLTPEQLADARIGYLQEKLSRHMINMRYAEAFFPDFFKSPSTKEVTDQALSVLQRMELDAAIKQQVAAYLRRLEAESGGVDPKLLAERLRMALKQTAIAAQTSSTKLDLERGLREADRILLYRLKDFDVSQTLLQQVDEILARTDDLPPAGGTSALGPEPKPTTPTPGGGGIGVLEKPLAPQAPVSVLDRPGTGVGAVTPTPTEGVIGPLGLGSGNIQAITNELASTEEQLDRALVATQGVETGRIEEIRGRLADLTAQRDALVAEEGLIVQAPQVEYVPGPALSLKDAAVDDMLKSQGLSETEGRPSIADEIAQDFEESRGPGAQVGVSMADQLASDFETSRSPDASVGLSFAEAVEQDLEQAKEPARDAAPSIRPGTTTSLQDQVKEDLERAKGLEPIPSRGAFPSPDFEPEPKPEPQPEPEPQPGPEPQPEPRPADVEQRTKVDEDLQTRTRPPRTAPPTPPPPPDKQARKRQPKALMAEWVGHKQGFMYRYKNLRTGAEISSLKPIYDKVPKLSGPGSARKSARVVKKGTQKGVARTDQMGAVQVRYTADGRISFKSKKKR